MISFTWISSEAANSMLVLNTLCMEDLFTGTQEEGLVFHALWTTIPYGHWVLVLSCKLR